jgi:hypothetical protein
MRVRLLPNAAKDAALLYSSLSRQSMFLGNIPVRLRYAAPIFRINFGLVVQRRLFGQSRKANN